MASVELQVTSLMEPKKNPNVMGDDMFARLTEAIKRFGFLQPVLVRQDKDGTYVIVDGVHRVRAAKAVGLTAVPCIITSSSKSEATALQVGMNRMRGDLDLSRVASAFCEMVADGWSKEELGVTGFGPDEVNELLKATTDNVEEEVMQGSSDLEPTEPAPDKEWKLELQFETKQELQKAKRTLRKLAGKGNELGTGLTKLIALNEE